MNIHPKRKKDHTTIRCLIDRSYSETAIKERKDSMANTLSPLKFLNYANITFVQEGPSGKEENGFDKANTQTFGND